MINPRSCLILTLDQIPSNKTSISRNISAEDYFRHEGLLDGVIEDKKIRKLSLALLDDPKADKELLRCIRIFTDLNKRALYEGLFLYFKKEELLELPEFSESFYDTYTGYFFNPSVIKDAVDRTDFLSRVVYASVRSWFQDIAVRSLDDVRFRLSGKMKEELDIIESLRETYKKSLHLFNTFTTTDPEKLAQYTKTGMFKNDKTIYDVAFKASANMIKIGEILLKNSREDKENFLDSWNPELITQGPDSFDVIHENPEVEEELKAMMAEVSPITTTDKVINIEEE